MDAPLPQRVCSSCSGLTPADEPLCAHCGAAFRSDLRWKVPLIVGLFLLAFAVSVAIQVM